LKIFQDARAERKVNPNLSIQLYQEFYDKFIASHEPYYAATALFEICRIFTDRHLYFPAMEYSLRAYQILADNHLEEKSNYFTIGIGNCYSQKGNYLVAEEYFRQAQILFSKNSDFHGEAVALNNIGLVK
jgi:tetratricopeptide (TPR) repeat protein